MLRKFIFLSIIIGLSACSSSIFNKVYVKYDDLKKEQLALYNFDGKASSIFKKSWGYPVHIQFKNIKGKKRQLSLLNLSFNIEPQKTISDTLYIKTDKKIFKIKAIEMVSVYKDGMNHQTQTEITQKEPDKSKKETAKEQIITHESTETYAFENIHLKYQLPQEFINQLKASDQVLLQFYIDDTPYYVKFRNAILNKIKKVYSNDTSL